MVISSAVVQAKQICTDFADMDFEHICERTKIDGHRLLLLIYCSSSLYTVSRKKESRVFQA